MAVNNAPDHGNYPRAPYGQYAQPAAPAAPAEPAASTGADESPATVESDTPDPLVEAFKKAGELPKD